MSATIIPLKIYFPKRGYQIGVAAKSLQHLRDTLQAKMGLSNTFKLTLDDGTIVCDPEYFKLLERQTKLNVIETSKTTTNATDATVDAQARKRMSPSTPTAANKRARLSPESRDKTDLNTNQNNSQLLSRICISSVAGNVPMLESPKPVPTSECSVLSTAVQRQKQLQSIVPQPQVQNISPQCTQTISLPPPPPAQLAQQLQNSRLTLQNSRRKPTSSRRPGSIIVLPQHPQAQQSIPSPQIHPSLLQQQRLQGPPLPQQIIVPSNQPHTFPGHPPTPLTAPPIMTPPTIQWIPHGTPRYPPRSVFPYGKTIHPQSPVANYPPGRVLYHHQLQVSPSHPPHPDMPMYRPRPPQPPQQLTRERERTYQMQVERQMKATIRMTPPPNPSQMPLAQPVQPQIRPTVVAQTRPMAVIQSPVGGPKYPVVQQARPPTPLPDDAHIVQQVVELLQAPEPSLIPSSPPALLKVICSKSPTDFRHASTPDLSTTSTNHSDLSNSTAVSGLSSPTRVSDSEPANLQGRQVTPAEDADSEDEHALQIVVGESEVLPPPLSTPPPPPCLLSSPHSQASSSPSRSPIVAAAQKKPRKPAELNLLSSQIDDGYCSATTSSLGSADDVKRALPFAGFDNYIPLHSCYNESKEDRQENDAIVSTVPQDKCTMTSPKDDSTDEHEQQDVTTTQTTASEGVENEPLIIEIPIKVIDGQIYCSRDGVTIKEEPDIARQEIIFIDSEADDHDSDVNPLEQFINQGTPTSSSSFHLSLDEEEVSEIDTDMDIDKSVESKGGGNDEEEMEQVVVADHGGEVPVVTTPLDSTVTFDLSKCVADLIDVVNSKDKDNDAEADAPCNLKSETRTRTIVQGPATLHEAVSQGTMCDSNSEAICTVEESVLIDSSNLHDEGLSTDELVMGNEVIVSLEGSSQSLDYYLDSSELISNLLLHSCLPQNGRRVSLS